MLLFYSISTHREHHSMYILGVDMKASLLFKKKSQVNLLKKVNNNSTSQNQPVVDRNKKACKVNICRSQTYEKHAL